METDPGIFSYHNIEIRDFIPENYQLTKKQEEEITRYNFKTPEVKSINLSGDKLIITSELSGAFCNGMQYYDLKNILSINNNGIAALIDLLKSLLKQGVEVQFVNVNQKIKRKIKSMGLDHILICR
jgi:ABC-type transporter Mla MlaB component